MCVCARARGKRGKGGGSKCLLCGGGGAAHAEEQGPCQVMVEGQGVVGRAPGREGFQGGAFGRYWRLQGRIIVF